MLTEDTQLYIDHRPWPGDNNGDLWPYCMLCKAWTNNGGHYKGSTHRHRRQIPGYFCTPAPTSTGSSVPTTPPGAGGPTTPPGAGGPAPENRLDSVENRLGSVENRLGRTMVDENRITSVENRLDDVEDGIDAIHLLLTSLQTMVSSLNMVAALVAPQLLASRDP